MFIGRINKALQVEISKIFAFGESTKGRNPFSRVFLISEKVVRRLPKKVYYVTKRIIEDPSFVRLVRRLKTYEATIRFLTPLNWVLVILRRNVKYENSVLHISYMVHIPYYTTRLLRKFGMKADYLALENGSPIWNKSDYLFLPSHVPFLKALEEFWFFWKVMAKYEIIHCHFSRRLTQSGWELPLLKRMGRKIVVHSRGCEVRNREKNVLLHPECNICQECDYNAKICTDEVRADLCKKARKYGDLFLVTTPDMKDFVPDAIYFPFFLPQIDYQDYVRLQDSRRGQGSFKIVHVTGHPGIEGTARIKTAIDNLQKKGYPIHFLPLHGVSHDRVLREIASSDLTIGKLKMGYYANAQIESMFLGVPAITYVRPEFMNEELENSGFIFSTLQDLEKTLEHYLGNPAEIQKKRKIARSSILQLHDDEKLGRWLITLYESIKRES